MQQKKKTEKVKAITKYVSEELCAACKPPDKISIDTWVEQNIILPEHTCPEPGPLKISRTPYTRGILQAFGSFGIEHIVIVMGRQMGKSQGVLYPCLSYTIAQDPGPALFVISTGTLAKYTSKKRLQPQFLQCEAVRKKLTSNPDDFTNLEMKFQNMALSIVGGGSLSQMISRPVRYLFRDEIDEITGNINSSADPLRAVQETTTAFANRKIVDTSTPTTEHGNIWQLLKDCQYVFEFWVPCIGCGTFQIMLWSRVKFDSEEKDREKIALNTWYECKHCKVEIREMQKADMVINGEWRARLSGMPTKDILEYRDADIQDTIILDEVLTDFSNKKIGFLIPKWYALFYNTTWGNAAKEYLEAVDFLRDYGDYTRLRDWSQYWDARPWVEKSEVKAVTDLLQNKIDIPSLIIPRETIALTCGVDMAQDGFWFVVLAWKRDMSCHVVQHGFLAGWESLTSLLWETIYQMEGEDRYLGIYRLGIDTGGTKYEGETLITMTEACYEWLRKNGRGRAFGIKGSSHDLRSGKKMQLSVIDKTPKGRRIIGGIALWLLDTDSFKDVLHYRLSIAAGDAGRLTFPSDVNTDLIKHILSEEKRLNRKTGKYEWVKISKLNHLLDALVYATAMADTECHGGIRVVAPLARKKEITEGCHEERKIKLKRKSSWVSGGLS